jgi:methylphosphotriester-DNA--protein-cysteine methyltransferase
MLSYSFDEMYNYAKDCNGNYDGKFFVAVKTTKIFCLPSCKAKFPLPKNLEFFESKIDAVKSGYRGCKRCYSNNWPFNKPAWLDMVVQFMKANDDRKINLDELTNLANVDPTTLRRYFKKHYKQSLMDYHRSLRLAKTKELLKNNTLQDVASICGFSSLKGFKIAYKNKFGMNPKSQIKINLVDEIK